MKAVRFRAIRVAWLVGFCGISYGFIWILGVSWGSLRFLRVAVRMVYWDLVGLLIAASCEATLLSYSCCHKPIAVYHLDQPEDHSRASNLLAIGAHLLTA